jgi:hypothetical protein
MCETDEGVIQGLIRMDIEAIGRIQAKPKVTLADRNKMTRIALHKNGLDTALTAITRRTNGNRT